MHRALPYSPLSHLLLLADVSENCVDTTGYCNVCKVKKTQQINPNTRNARGAIINKHNASLCEGPLAL